MATQYLTVAELALSVDSTLLAKLGADGGSTGVVDQSNDILTTAISVASASIDAAATRNNLYAVVDLSDLYDDGDWCIRGMCAGLALGWLYSRRGKETPTAVAERVDAANRMLDDLRNGAKVFAIETNRQAGLPQINVIPASTAVQLNLEGRSGFYPQENTQVYP